MSLPDAVPCSVHPRRPADGACVRCGAFRCEDCSESPFYKEHCAACAERLSAPAATRSIVAVIFGGISLGCYCFPIGIVAVVLGNMEIAAIDRGESAERGRSYAQAAKVLGWIGIGLTGVFLVAFLIGWLAADAD